MLKYAIIGTGWITGTYIGGAMKDDRWELAAVYSRSYDKGRSFADQYLSAAHGNPIRIYTSLEDMSKDPQIDAVYIASPNRFHVEQSRLMLEAGKHVICEKPIAIRSEDLIELTRLADSKGLVYMEAIMMEHQPQIRVLKEAVDRIGEIYTAHVDFSQLSSKYQLYKDGKNPNIFNPAMCTGALEDLGVYNFYALIELFGVPDRIDVVPLFLNTGADGAGQVVCTYHKDDRPDLQVTVTYSKVGQSRLGSQIMGDKGTITIESISQLTGMNLYDNKGAVTALWGNEEKNTLMGREAADFARYILDPQGTKEEYDYIRQQSLKVCRLMEQIREKGGIRFKADGV